MRPLCRTLLLTLLSTTLILGTLFYILAVRPYITSLRHELSYFNDFDLHYRADAGRSSEYLSDFPEPLIHNLEPLRSWSWEDQLDFHSDRRSKRAGLESWVYVGGTPRAKLGFPWDWVERMSVYSRPGGGCVDPEPTCSAFNAAFNTIIEPFFASPNLDTKTKALSYMDCDHSPMLCDDWGIGAVMLVHIKTLAPCQMHKSIGVKCGVKMSYVTLPLPRMSWTRQYRVPGKKWVVPAFPDAEEQVRSVILHNGAVEGLIEGHGVEIMETVVDDVDGKMMRGEFDEQNDIFRKIKY